MFGAPNARQLWSRPNDLFQPTTPFLVSHYVLATDEILETSAICVPRLSDVDFAFIGVFPASRAPMGSMGSSMRYEREIPIL